MSITAEDVECPDCKGGWLCKKCRVETQARWMRRQKAIALAAEGLRQQEIGRTMIRLELESDEAGTAEQKAIRILAGFNPIPAHMMISGV